MKLLKRISCLLLIGIVLIGCNGTKGNGGIAGGYQIYYVNNSQTDITYQNYSVKSKERDNILDEILEQLEGSTDSIEYISAKPEEVNLVDYSIEGETLCLQFDNKYLQMDKTTEVLMRMAYVKTLVQLSGIEYVEFYVEDQPLTNSNGDMVGAMNKDTFVSNDGNEVNEYENTELVLYFASEDGASLVQTVKKVTHSANMSLERVVMEQLIAGPSSNTDEQPTIPKDTKIISISTKDSICYVTLSSAFLGTSNSYGGEIQIYSIVNSLAELSTVSKVQISVEGDTANSLASNKMLDTVLERNLDLIETGGE